MAERFEKLYILPSNLYAEGTPIIISAGSLLKDTETGKVIAQIKYHSISSMPIKALKIKIAAYDISGVELEGVDEYQYLDLNVKQGQDFGANKAIVLPNVVTRSFSIASVEVVFSNGISQSVVMPMKSLPQSEYLSSLLRNDELVKQYQIETSKNALYVPQKASNLWCCSCGEWNSNGSCTRCGVDFTVANKYLDPSLLEPKMAERIINEKQAREQQQQAAIEQEKLAKENQKRKKKKTTILVIVAVLVVGIISGLLYYSSQHKYDEIAGIYVLQDLDDAEEAFYKYQKDTIDEYGFNPYSYEIDIRGSGKVYGLWFVNDRGSMTPRAATVKSVSADGVVEFDVLDYPDAKVTMTINIETGEATYTSKGLTLKYHRISKELANNGYKECSVNDVRKEISFIQDLFELKSVEAICAKYPEATTEGAKHDLKIDGAFCGATGTYEIWLDGVWRITFEQGIYDTNTEKENLITNLDNALGKGSYSERYDAYSWESDTYNMQIDYWPHEGVYFFLNSPSTDSSEQGSDNNSSESNNDDADNSLDNDTELEETFISNGHFTFTPRSFIKRFDEADKSANGYNYTYMRMNGEASLFYELAEISGGYSNVRSVGLISFVKNIDTTLSIEEDYTENIITKINVLVEDADDVPPILVSCMCAVDPSLNFTSAFNLGIDAAEKAGTTSGYTHNEVNYVIFADGEYYYIVISVAGAHADEEHKTECEVLGHSWVNATCTVPMTCSRCNKTNGTALGHDWGNPTCTTPRSCCVCFEVDPNSKPLGHSFVGGECMVCGVDEVQEPNEENKDDTSSDGVQKLTVSNTNVSLNNSSQIITITVPDSYEGEVYCTVVNSDVLSTTWGGWFGNTVTLTLIPESSGNTTIEIYLNDGDSVVVNVTAIITDYSSNAADYTTLRIAPATYYTFNDDEGYSSDIVLLESANYKVSDNGDGTVNITISGTMQRKTNNISTYIQIGYSLYVDGEDIKDGTVGTDAPALNQSYSYTLELRGLQPGNYIIYFTSY